MNDFYITNIEGLGVIYYHTNLNLEEKPATIAEGDYLAVDHDFDDTTPCIPMSVGDMQSRFGLSELPVGASFSDIDVFLRLSLYAHEMATSSHNPSFVLAKQFAREATEAAESSGFEFDHSVLGRAVRQAALNVVVSALSSAAMYANGGVWDCDFRSNLSEFMAAAEYLGINPEHVNTAIVRLAEEFRAAKQERLGTSVELPNTFCGWTLPLKD